MAVCPAFCLLISTNCDDYDEYLVCKTYEFCSVCLNDIKYNLDRPILRYWYQQGGLLEYLHTLPLLDSETEWSCSTMACISRLQEIIEAGFKSEDVDRVLRLSTVAYCGLQVLEVEERASIEWWCKDFPNWSGRAFAVFAGTHKGARKMIFDLSNKLEKHSFLVLQILFISRSCFRKTSIRLWTAVGVMLWN